MSAAMGEITAELLTHTPGDWSGFMERFVEHEMPPTYAMSAYITDLSVQVDASDPAVSAEANGRMQQLIPVMRDIREDVVECLLESSTPRVLHPDLSRGLLDNGIFHLPMADARSWLTFLSSDEVHEVIDDGVYRHYGGDPTELPYIRPDLSGVRDRIAELPITQHEVSLDWVCSVALGYFYREPKLRSSADAITRVVGDVTASLLLPLTMTIERRLAKDADGEGGHYPVLTEYDTPVVVAKDGIIWGEFDEDTVRKELIHDCDIDRAHYATFDDDKLEEEILSLLYPVDGQAYIDEMNRRAMTVKAHN